MTTIPSLYEEEVDFRARVIERMTAFGVIVAAGTATISASTTTTSVTEARARSGDHVVFVANDSTTAAALPWVNSVSDGAFELGHSSAGSDREVTYIVIAGPGVR